MQRQTTHSEEKSLSTEKKLTLRALVKIACAGILAFVMLIGISSVGATVSYFSDVESSIGNYLRADPLGFSVSIATTSIDLQAGEQLLVPVMTPAEDSELIQYFVRASVLGGVEEFCNAIQVLTTAPFPHDGALAGLVTPTTTDTGPWALTVSLPPDTTFSPDASCNIDLSYVGWNADVPWGQGYTDIKHLSLLFYIGTTSQDSGVGIVEGTSTPDIILPEASTTPEIPAVMEEHNGGGGGGGDAPVVEEPPADIPVATTTEEMPPVDTPPADTPPADTPVIDTPPADTPPADPPPEEPPPAAPEGGETL